MAEENLEHKVNAQKKEEKPKEIAVGESVSSEIKQASTGLINSTIGAAAIGASTALFGLDGLIFSSAFPAGGFIESKIMDKSKSFTAKNFRDEAITGALFTAPLWYGTNTLRQIPKSLGIDGLVNILGYSIPASALAVGGLTFAAIPLFNSIYYPIKYVVDNKTFKGIGKDFKENYKKTLGRALALGVPWAGAVAASVAMPSLYPFLFPVLAGLEVAYRVALSKEKLNYAKLLNPFTYIPKFANPFYVASGAASAAGRVYGSITTAISDFGSVVRDWFKKPAPTPEPKPA